jgi:hypothetical protein
MELVADFDSDEISLGTEAEIRDPDPEGAPCYAMRQGMELFQEIVLSLLSDPSQEEFTVRFRLE